MQTACIVDLGEAKRLKQCTKVQATNHVPHVDKRDDQAHHDAGHTKSERPNRFTSERMEHGSIVCKLRGDRAGGPNVEVRNFLPNQAGEGTISNLVQRSAAKLIVSELDSRH
jgi:hypothetical protein